MRGLRGVMGAGLAEGEDVHDHDHGDEVVNGHKMEDEKEGDDVEDEGMMMLAIRFNVFSDTELVSPWCLFSPAFPFHPVLTIIWLLLFFPASFLTWISALALGVIRTRARTIFLITRPWSIYLGI